MRLVFLDSGPLGLLSNPRSSPQGDLRRRRINRLTAAGVRLFVPEIADYEVRRELIRVGASAGLRRLDELKDSFEYSPITTEVMLRAAELWADARRVGRPTAAPDALDGDCILAAQALLAAGPGDLVTAATGNAAHLGRFVDAQTWEAVTP